MQPSSKAKHSLAAANSTALNWATDRWGRPHYGGIVERIIGTALQQIHELPGTTFSNPTERGQYDSEQMAALTLDELEKWLTLAVATYHGTVH